MSLRKADDLHNHTNSQFSPPLSPLLQIRPSNELLERAVDWRPRLDSLVEVDRGKRALDNAFWSKLEFLLSVRPLLLVGLQGVVHSPCIHPCRRH